MISKHILENLYARRKKSMKEIADRLGCSVQQVRYWMNRYQILSRSISEAIYQKHNPNGDPFSFRYPENIEEAILYGMGLGFYWGEGTKANKDSVRLGNTDPKLLARFIDFLVLFYGIRRKDLKFGLQIFTDISQKSAMDFWIKTLKIKKSQFYKPFITPSGSLGTYRKKSLYGVLTVMYHNKKLRDLLITQLPM